MAALALRSKVRVGVLLTILAAVLAGPVVHATLLSSANGAPGASHLTPAQKTAAQAALNRVDPPPTFIRYTRWRLSTSSSTAVPCLARPAICFGSTAVARPLTLSALAILLAQFDVRVKNASCSTDAWLPILTCEGTATIRGYVLGFIVTAERAVRPDERPGTQVILFAISRA